MRELVSAQSPKVFRAKVSGITLASSGKKKKKAAKKKPAKKKAVKRKPAKKKAKKKVVRLSPIIKKKELALDRKYQKKRKR